MINALKNVKTVLFSPRADRQEHAQSSVNSSETLDTMGDNSPTGARQESVNGNRLPSPQSPSQKCQVQVARPPQPTVTDVHPERAGNVVLQGRDAMLCRLREVDDNPHFVEKFYPILLKDAGRELNPMGVCIMLLLAICDYTQGMPPIKAKRMEMRAKDFIGALVPNSPEIRHQAEEFWDKPHA